MTTLIIHSDLDCKVYIDTELHGLAKAGEDYTISLNRGAYWIECVSQENEADRTDFDFRTDGSGRTEHSEIALKPIRYKRLVSQYDYVGEFRCGFAEVKKNDKTIGYINDDGEIVYDNQTFEQLIPFGKNTICVKIKRYWGIFHSSGEYIIEPQYSLLKPIDSELAIFCKQNYYGLINANGNILITAKYFELFKIEGAELLCCALNGKYGLLDYHGNKITPLKYKQIDAFCGNLSRVRIGGGLKNDAIVGLNEYLIGSKYGFIDTSGKEVIPCEYDYAFNFHNDVALVNIGGRYCEDEYKISHIGGKWGAVNQMGIEIIPTIYDYVSDFSEGFAIIGLGDKKGIVNHNGKVLIAPQYDIVINFINGLAVIGLNGKYGYINKDGIEVIPLKYDHAYSFYENIAIVQLNSKYGLIDKTGNEVVPCIYDNIENFENGLAKVRIEDKRGVIDKSGKEVIKCQYNEQDFATKIEMIQAKLNHHYIDSTDSTFNNCNDINKDTLKIIKLEGKYGCIDIYGNEIIPCKYDKVRFSYNTLRVELDGKFGFVDYCGEELISCKYEESDRGYFSSGLMCVHDGEKYGFIDYAGRERIPCQYEYAEGFERGLAFVRKDGKCCFVDEDGKVIISITNNSDYSIRNCGVNIRADGNIYFISRKNKIYDYAEDFQLGLVKVVRKYKWGLIDCAGNEVTPLLYENICDFSEGISLVSIMNDENTYGRHKYGYIDENGKPITLCKYDNADAFENGLAKVAIRDGENIREGYIDKTGKEVIPLMKYDYVGRFKDGLVIVKQNDLWGSVDKYGKEVIPITLKYDYIFDFEGGLAKVWLNEKYGYINKTGDEIIPCKFDEIESFKNGLARTTIASYTDFKYDRKYGYINSLGVEVIPCMYDSVWLENRIVCAELNSETFYFYKSGKSIPSDEYLEYVRDKYEYDFRQDTWWALTDGQYGDMPENWDGDTDFLGY